jgi:hypothetical protein
MAYDAATRTVLLFGGQGSQYPVYLGDMWSWNGTAWTRLSPPASPPATTWTSMAYDAAARTVLLLDGGECSPCGGRQATTWSWNGTAWTRLPPLAGTPAGGGWSMAYDPATATVLLFGGTSIGSPAATALDETWSWNGSAWTRLSPAGSPPPGNASMAYDPAMDAMLLTGPGNGNSASGDGQLNGTWTLTAPSRPGSH